MQPTNQNKPKPILPLLLVVVGALIIIGVVIWQVQPQPPTAPAAAVQVSPTIAIDQVDRVSLENAKQAFDEKTAIFVDVRSADSFALGHIPGAKNYPLAQIEADLSELKPDQWIITYCT